jgi:hypothetical protein
VFFRAPLKRELDTYLDALKGFPDFTKLVTEKAMLFVKTGHFLKAYCGLLTPIILPTGMYLK